MKRDRSIEFRATKRETESDDDDDDDQEIERSKDLSWPRPTRPSWRSQNEKFNAREASFKTCIAGRRRVVTLTFAYNYSQNPLWTV